MLAVQPLPGARREVLPEVIGVDDVEKQSTVLLQHAGDLPQDFQVILGRIEIAEAIPGQQHGIERPVGVWKASTVALPESDGELLPASRLPGAPDQVARPV